MNEMTSAEKDACDGCQKRPCVCETVVLPSAENDVDVAIKAQNPDLETAWRTIAWWQETCAYWRDEAYKGYALRDSLAARVLPPANHAPTSEGGA